LFDVIRRIAGTQPVPIARLPVLLLEYLGHAEDLDGILVRFQTHQLH
jgi:hypothetical protein